MQAGRRQRLAGLEENPGRFLGLSGAPVHVGGVAEIPGRLEHPGRVGVPAGAGIVDRGQFQIAVLLVQLGGAAVIAGPRPGLGGAEIQSGLFQDLRRFAMFFLAGQDRRLHLGRQRGQIVSRFLKSGEGAAACSAHIALSKCSAACSASPASR